MLFPFFASTFTVDSVEFLGAHINTSFKVTFWFIALELTPVIGSVTVYKIASFDGRIDISTESPPTPVPVASNSVFEFVTVIAVLGVNKGACVVASISPYPFKVNFLPSLILNAPCELYELEKFKISPSPVPEFTMYSPFAFGVIGAAIPNPPVIKNVINNIFVYLYFFFNILFKNLSVSLNSMLSPCLFFFYILNIHI